MVRKFLLLGIIFISIFTITTSVDAFTISKSVGNNIGLIGHWTFDGIDMVGGKAWDISGSGNHGTLTNISTSTFYTKGKIGQGLNFDGSDDYVSLSSDPVSSYSSSHSYCAWFNSSVSNIQQSIVSTLTDTNNNAMLGLSSTGIVSFYYKGGSASYGGYKSGVYSTNTWTYLCGVFDGSSVKIYKDGVDVGSLLTHHVNAAGNRVGKSTYNYTGYIDDVRIYNRALSANEIKALYNASASNRLGTAINNSVDNGLVGHWTFDGKDMVNGKAWDISGSANHGTLQSISTSTFYTRGKIGQGLNFDGTNSYISLTSAIATSYPRSSCIWIKPELTGTTQYMVYQTPFQFRLSQSGSLLQLGLYNGSNSIFTSYGDIAVSVWQHVCVTVAGDRIANLYIDGEVAVTPLTLNSTSHSGAAYIGANNGSGPFKGTMDDVRIYNRELSAEEVKKLYEQSAGTKTSTTQSRGSGLVGHWTFDGKDMLGGKAWDVSGSGNHGSLNGISTSTFYTKGKIGQGVNFDGTNDYIQMSDNANLSPGTGNITITGWFKSGPLAGGSTYVMYSDRGSATNHLIYVYSDGNRPACVIRDGSANMISLPDYGLSSLKDDDKWHFVACVKDSQTTAKLYVISEADGTFVREGTNASMGTITLSDGNPPKIGSLSGGSIFYWLGQLDDVRVYNRALSAQEIQALYDSGR